MKEWVIYYNHKGKLLSYKITEGALANGYGKEVRNIADAIEAFENRMTEFELQDVSRYNIVRIHTWEIGRNERIKIFQGRVRG